MEPAVTFRSVLFPGPEPAPGPDGRDEPPFFRDLNLDQVIGAVTAGRDEYDLTPFFHAPLSSADSIAYRHEMLRELDGTPVLPAVTSFARAMRAMRERLGLAGKLHYPLQRQRWFLDAVDAYCDAVTGLAGELRDASLSSRGMRGFRDYLTAYVASDGFTALTAETKQVAAGLADVSYSLQIKGNRIRVRRYEDEQDYSQDVARTFEKFRQHDVKDYRVRYPSPPDMNHVEAGVLSLVAKLFGDAFGALDAFCQRQQDYLDQTVARFDREVQFYLAYLEFAGQLRAAGLSFCYPEVRADSKQVHARETFDLALAGKLVPAGETVVRNDFYLAGPERILVVTGPNQGGKTTLARTFGQLHYLARLGCLVPGTSARLYLCDQIYTHFEKEEDLATLSGKLADDLIRIRDILTSATGDSVIIMNEIFTSTTLTDALQLAREILGRIITLDALCVCVTFLDELASLGETTVSMMATVVPGNPAERTYRVVRKPADGLAYAQALAAQYGLTYEQLTGRIPA